MKRLMLLIMLLSCTWALAQEHESHSAAAPATAHHEAVDNQPHPVISQDSTWAGSMVILILGMFLAAAAVGVAVRANMPEELPPTHSHDEPPGGSGHHGASGTVDQNDPATGHPPHGHGH